MNHYILFVLEPVIRRFSFLSLSHSKLAGKSGQDTWEKVSLS